MPPRSPSRILPTMLSVAALLPNAVESSTPSISRCSFGLVPPLAVWYSERTRSTGISARTRFFSSSTADPPFLIVGPTLPRSNPPGIRAIVLAIAWAISASVMPVEKLSMEPRREPSRGPIFSRLAASSRVITGVFPACTNATASLIAFVTPSGPPKDPGFFVINSRTAAIICALPGVVEASCCMPSVRAFPERTNAALETSDRTVATMPSARFGLP